jgi:hypothetical protein
MKIYDLSVGLNLNHAQLRIALSQSIEYGKPIEIMWQNLGVTGNKVNDFIFCVNYVCCKENIAKELYKEFPELEYFDTIWIRNLNEIDAEDKIKLVWLPKKNINIKILYTHNEIKYLKRSSVTIDIIEGQNYMDIVGVEQNYGNKIIPRQKGKGLYFSKKDIKGRNIFKPVGTNSRILCTENVKQFCIGKNYTNIIFYEYGEVI